MLTEIQLDQYIELHNISSEAADYIFNTRNNQPSRMVGVHARTNVCTWLFSEKMEQSISVESRTAERAFVILTEVDEDVLEIWEQPEPIPIVKHTRNGSLRKSSYTPDFLVLRKSGPCVVEVKDESTIEKLLFAASQNWVKRDDGTVNYIPAKNFFDGLGLGFEVFVASKDIRYRIFNHEMILRARQSECAPISEKTLDVVFGESYFWSLHAFKIRLNVESFTAILKCIDNKQLYIDIDNSLLSEPRGCYVVRKKELLPYIKEFKTQKIYSDSLLSEVNQSVVPSSAYAEEALSRMSRINSGEKSRSIRRWRVSIAEGAEQGLSDFQSLIPKWFFAGNRKRKINKVVDDFLLNYLLESHASSNGLSNYRSYIRYRVDSQEAHPLYPSVSKTTFLRRLNAISPDKIALIRKGKRGANAVSDPTDPKERALKVEIAWQCAAIDHYLADIYLVFFDDQEVPHVMRPWLTVMIDLATGSVLAFSISFLNPSRRSVAKVMRDCVRRHGFLPKQIIVDRGSDFRSVYFSALLAHLKIELMLRPASHGRYGGEVEGLFGEFKKQWLTQRPGNVTDFKEARAVDGKLRPDKLAVLTPYDFYEECEAFISWRDSRPKGLNIESPRNMLLRHMREYPFVAIPQKYDDKYALATAVDSKKYKVDFQRGIHISGMWYWTPGLTSIRGRQKAVEVRIDPENPHVIYALADAKWQPCYGSKINRFSAMDSISQWVDGLIAIDAFSERQKIKQSADEEIVRIIKTLSEGSKKRHESQVAYIQSPDNTSGGVTEESIFDLLREADIQPLIKDSWKVTHDKKH